MKIYQRVLSGFVSACILLSASAFPFSSVSVQATDEEVPVSVASEPTSYEIYPLVQSIEYLENTSTVTDTLNLVYAADIESYTLNKLKGAFSGKNFNENAHLDDHSMTVYLSIGNQVEAVNTILQENQLTLPTEGDDAYLLFIKDGKVVINAANYNSLFFGVTTLKHILRQTPTALRNLVIKDYANVKYRGFIEGYYGIPWSHENRLSLMELGGDFKTNTYIFAPKDDIYHSSHWRELYPTNELAKIRELVEKGKETHTKFVWTIHLFMHNRFDFNHYDRDYNVLIQKFEQLYENGVRQFGILADDVGALDRNHLLRLLNDVSRWATEKTDVEDILFCPAGYNHAWQRDYSELKVLNRAPANVQIFWTGNSVVNYVNQSAIDNFTNGSSTNGHPGRKPFFWLNWPVNDYKQSRLLMGPGTIMVRGTSGLSGLVTNPMQQAQASKVGIFATADFGWNSRDFDAVTSWRNSFKYIEPDVPEALMTIAEHLQDVSPSGHGLVLNESENFAADIRTLTADLEEENFDAFTTHVQVYLQKLNALNTAIETFKTGTRNQGLLQEMTPWLSAFSEIIQAQFKWIEGLNSTNKSDMWNAFEAANRLLAQSKTHRVPHVNNHLVLAEPGAKRLQPFLTVLNRSLERALDVVTQAENGASTEALRLHPFYNSSILRTYDPANGDMSKLVDGNNSTAITVYSKEGDFLPVDAHVGVRLDGPKWLDRIVIRQGRNGATGDTFGRSVLEYSLDGRDYLPIQEVAKGADVDLVLNTNIRAQYIRLRNLERVPVWSSIREFQVTERPPVKMFTNVSALAEELIQANFDQFALSSVRHTLEPNQYVGIDLQRIREVTGIETNSSLTLQYSMNDVVYHDAPATYPLKARYIRLINKTDAPVSFNAETLRVTTHEYRPLSVVATNYGSMDHPLAAFDQNLGTVAWYKESQHAGKYIVYDLGKTISLSKVRMVVQDSDHDFIRHGRVSVSANNQDFTEVLNINATSEEDINTAFPVHDISMNYKEATFAATPARYVKIEITQNKSGADKWARFNELILNDYEYIPSMNLAELETESVETLPNNKGLVKDGSLLTSFKSETAGSLIYYVDHPSTFKSFSVFTSGSEPMTISIQKQDESWHDLGALDDTYKTVPIEEGEHLLAVKLSFEGASRRIHEIVFNGEVVREDEYTQSGSETANNTVNKAFDKDMNTRWASQKRSASLDNPHFVQVKYGAPKNMSGIKIHWERANTKKYTVEASFDGKRYETVYTQNLDTKSNSYIDTILFGEIKPVHKLRIKVTDFDPNAYDFRNRRNVNWATVSIYEVEPLSDLVTLGTANFVTENALTDKNLDTHEALTQAQVLELETLSPVENLNVYLQGAEANAQGKTYQLEYSEDGQQYFPLHESTQTEGHEALHFVKALNMKYLRVTPLGTNVRFEAIAFEPLSREVRANKTALLEKYNAVRNTEKGSYTTVTYEAFQQALREAQAILDLETAEQGAVDQALANLTEKFEALAEKQIVNATKTENSNVPEAQASYLEESFADSSVRFHVEKQAVKDDEVAYELHFVNESGQQVQPLAGVTIRLPLLPNRTLKAVMRTHNGQEESITEKRVENGFVIFESDKFSVYRLVYEPSATPVVPEPEKPVNPVQPEQPGIAVKPTSSDWAAINWKYVLDYNGKAVHEETEKDRVPNTGAKQP